MAVLCLTQLMVVLDGTIVNVALPTIREDLGFSTAGLSWVVNGFFVTFAGLLLLAGRLGDLVGSRRVFVVGLVVFTLASLACGLAGSPEALVAARLVQGVGGALASAVVLGLIARLHDDPVARTRAFAVFAFVGSAGASVGVVAGGLLTEAVSWHWVFLVNVPVGLLAVPAALRFLDDDRVATGWRGVRSGLDPRHLVPRRLFRGTEGRRFTLANAVLFTMTVAGFTFQFLSALYLQDVLGLDPLRTGLSYLPVTLAIAVSSLLVSERLAARFGAERVLVGGLALFVGGLLLMARLPEHGSYLVDVAPAFAVMGAGFGLAMPQVTTLAMSAAAPELGGVASGTVNTTQQVGGALGLFATAAAAAAWGLDVGFLIAAGALAAGALLAVRLLPRRAYRSESGRVEADQCAAPTLETCSP